MLLPLGLSEREAVGIAHPCQRLTAGSKPVSRSNRSHGYNRMIDAVALKKKRAKRRKGKIVKEMSNMKSIFCETVLRGKGVGYIGITSRGNRGKTEHRFDSSLAHLFVPTYLVFFSF